MKYCLEFLFSAFCLAPLRSISPKRRKIKIPPKKKCLFMR